GECRIRTYQAGPRTGFDQFVCSCGRVRALSSPIKKAEHLATPGQKAACMQGNGVSRALLASKALMPLALHSAFPWSSRLQSSFARGAAHDSVAPRLRHL